MAQRIYKSALIGYGHWGQVLLRNLRSSDRFQPILVCDRNLEKTKDIEDSRVTQSADEVFASSEVEVVFISTQAASHGALTQKAIASGKHVFVEKPFVLDSNEGKRLAKQAKKKKLCLMVDHTYLFNPAYLEVKRLIANGAIGDLRFVDSFRADFGRIQIDSDILQHLLYHDIYVVLDLFGERKLQESSYSGFGTVFAERDDIATVGLKFDNNSFASIHGNLLYPTKQRKMAFGGTKGTIYWDDNTPDGPKLFQFDNRVEVKNTKPFVVHQVGHAKNFSIPEGEAIQAQFSYLANCLDTQSVPKNGPEAALRVIDLIDRLRSTGTRKRLKNAS